jgi:hypothetical protein
MNLNPGFQLQQWQFFSKACFILGFWGQRQQIVHLEFE